mgnify:CR=1 FL=1
MVIVKVAIPLWYPPTVVASFLPPLAPAELPEVLAEAPAAAVRATALASALNSKLPEVNSSRARLSSKKITWLKPEPPS